MLVSGTGGNLQALLDAGIDVSLVIADRRCRAWERARAVPVPAAMLDHGAFAGQGPFEDALAATLRAFGISLVALAGFMRVLGPAFVRHYKGKMVNIHPSLLPKFQGLDTHARVLEAGETTHGCTVHWVTEEVDQGPVIRQAKVQVLEGDDATTLAARVTKAEHKLYPAVIKDILAGKERPPW